MRTILPLLLALATGCAEASSLGPVSPAAADRAGRQAERQRAAPEEDADRRRPAGE